MPPPSGGGEESPTNREPVTQRPPLAMPVENPILHLVLLNLRPAPASPDGAPDESAIQAVLAAFGSLASIDGVLRLGAVQAADEQSTHSLALFALLRDAAALEEFGTHPRHIEYLQSAVLPRVSDLVTADVVAAGTPPPAYRAAACFCADFRPTTFDWQVRSLFDAAALAPGNSTLGGLAVNDRQRFRAAGLALWSNEDDCSAGHLSEFFHRLWQEHWGPAATDQAWVIGPAMSVGPKVPEAAP